MKILFICTLLLLVSCNKQLNVIQDIERTLGIHEWHVYNIQSGNHFSDGLNGNILSTDHIDFLARFNETAIYTATTKSNQNDINKLYGFSDCNCDVEKNSARFGWNWSPSKNKIQIYAYIHVDGKIINPTYMGTVNFNEEASYSIYIVGQSYNFNFNGNLVNIKSRGCGEQRDIRGILYPYFGGDDTAPHQINISIKQL